MITFSLCLIYYGIGLLLYQGYGWFADDRWEPFPILRAWQAFFGSPVLDWPVLGPILRWVLDWPLSLTLVVAGFGLIGFTVGLPWLSALREGRLRRGWFAAQFKILGYAPWAVVKRMRDVGVSRPRRGAAGSNRTR